MQQFIAGKSSPSSSSLPLAAAALLGIIIVLGALFTNYLGMIARNEIVLENEIETRSFAIYLTAELKSIESAARSLAGSPAIVSALAAGSPSETAQAHAVLDRYNASFETAVCYIMNSEGTAVFSSNRSSPDSFLGRNYAFRSYFQESLRGTPSHYFALGITSRKRGFYAAHPIRERDGSVIGVAVVKKDLDDVENYLMNYPHCFFVSPQGIVFLSSRPSALFTALAPLDRAAERELLDSKQFGDEPFRTLFTGPVADNRPLTYKNGRYLASHKPVYGDGWSVVFLAPTDRIGMYRAIGIVTTAFVALLVLGLIFVIRSVYASAQAVMESEERFNQVAGNSRDWIWELGPDLRYRYASSAVKDILGHEPGEILGRSYGDFIAPGDRHEIVSKMRETFARGEPLGYTACEYMHRDGRSVFIESNGTPVFDGTGSPIGYRGAHRDITRRRRTEETLRQTLDTTRVLLESLPVGAVIIGLDRRIRWMNGTARKTLGADSSAVLIGTECHRHICPDEEGACPVLDLHRTLETAEKTVIALDGRHVPVLKTVVPVLLEGEEVLLEAFIDITDRKLAENDRGQLQTQLLRAEKMAAVGQLASGVAREINTPLNDILRLVKDLAARLNESTETLRGDLGRIESLTLACKSIAHSLLVFAHGDAVEFTPLDINTVVRNAAALAAPQAEAGTIAVVEKFEQALPGIPGSAPQLERVFLNLITNAFHAMGRGGTLTIETERWNRNVVVRFADTGCGMPEHVLERIFEPFFTTRQGASGSGLGLSICRMIIEKHGGRIDVESRVGAGSVFTVVLHAGR